LGYRSLAIGAAAASAAAHIFSVSAAILSLESTPIFPADLGSPAYLALLLWIAVAAVSSACFVVSLAAALRSGRSMYRFETVECYRLVSAGVQGTPRKRPEGKKPRDGTQ
jgi:hypothetical protein